MFAKQVLILLTIWEMFIKTSLKFCSIPFSIGFTKKTGTKNMLGEIDGKKSNLTHD